MQAVWNSPRRRILLAASLVAIFLLLALTVFLLSRGQDLKARLALISPGMTREQVEDILGPPVLFLPKGANAPGDLLAWVDQLWQVEVVIGPDGRVIKCRCTPSLSFFRGTIGRILPLPK